MSSDEEITAPNELVIIKRRVCDDGDGHHGGAWKIAYADFMTAMMAFFLVMWLINSTDDKSLTQIANYFNPIELNDKLRSTKGLNDIDDKRPKKEKSGEKVIETTGKKGPEDKADPGGKPRAGAKERRERELFADPERVLAGLAQEALKEERRRWGLESDHLSGPAAGDAFRDPFAPAFLNDLPAPSPGTGQSGAGAGAGDKDNNAKPALETVVDDKPSPSPPEQMKVVNRPAHLRLEDEIKQALGKLAPGVAPNIDVAQTSDGLLISITDEYDFGMFEIASARPRPELVLVMEKLAAVLKTRAEKLVIRGHTDGRPFRSKTYDNWRLSTARAHIARHMLLRGGIAEARIMRIEGHADHRLRLPADPNAAQNRRIEILLPGPKL